MKLPLTGPPSQPAAGPLTATEEARRLFLSPAGDHPKTAALVLTLSVLFLFGRALLLGGVLVSTPDGDLANQFFAWRQFGFSELAKGHLALWNPYLFCGSPFFAGFQSALLYPPNWLFLILPLVFALNFSIALHVFGAGFFTFLWMARQGLGFLAALFGSFVFMLGGAFFLHVYPGHLTNLCAMAWIPLVFLYAEKILESPGLKNVLAGAGVLSLQLLSGHPQYFLYTLLFASLYALALVLRNPAQGTQKVSAGIALGLTAAALTAVQWLPALRTAGEYGRDLSTSGSQAFFSLPPLALLGIFSSGLAGGNKPTSCWVAGRLWWESTPFIGTAAFLFALNALRQGRRGQNLLPLGLALLALLLALGPATPLEPLLEHLPLFHFFRGSFKFCIFFQAFAALLAARGLHAWLTEGTDKGLSRWAWALASLIFLLVLGTAETSGPLKIDRLISLSEALLGFLLLGILGASGKFHLKIVLALLGMLNLGAFAFSLSPSFDVEPWLAEGEAVKAKLAPSLEDGRIYWAAHNDRSMALRLPDIWGDDPMISKRFSAFLAYPADSTADPAANTSPDRQRLNLTPVKGALTRLGFLIGFHDGQLGISASPFPRLPRAFLVGNWRKTGGLRETLQDLTQPGFNPQTQVLLEKAPDPLPQDNGGKGTLVLTDHGSDRIEFQVRNDHPQILLMTDNYGSGWASRPYPDDPGATYHIMPGDGFARAIPLPAGVHHFDLVYDPPGFDLGRRISLAALPLYILGWAWMVWTRRRKERP